MNQLNSIKGVYLITGGSSGIGLQISKDLLTQGYSVIIASRKSPVDILTFSIEDFVIDDSRLYYVSIDLTDEMSIILFTNKLIGIKFNGFVNCAGISSLMPLKAISGEDINKTIWTNFLGPIHLVKSILKNKLLIKGASMVFISSINGTSKGSKAHTIYAASKGGINGFVMALSNELSSQKIRVNAIAPGMVKTQIYEDVKNNSIGDGMKEHIGRYPLGIGEVEDVSDVALFLLSNKSKWITGQILIVDGGISIT